MLGRQPRSVAGACQQRPPTAADLKRRKGALPLNLPSASKTEFFEVSNEDPARYAAAWIPAAHSDADKVSLKQQHQSLPAPRMNECILIQRLLQFITEPPGPRPAQV